MKILKYGLRLIGNHYRHIQSCSTSFPLDYTCQFPIATAAHTQTHLNTDYGDFKTRLATAYVHASQMCNIQISEQIN